MILSRWCCPQRICLPGGAASPDGGPSEAVESVDHFGVLGRVGVQVAVVPGDGGVVGANRVRCLALEVEVGEPRLQRLGFGR